MMNVEMWKRIVKTLLIEGLKKCSPNRHNYNVILIKKCIVLYDYLRVNIITSFSSFVAFQQVSSLAHPAR